MGRTFVERLKSGEWWAEQAAHGWMGAAASIAVQAIGKATGLPRKWRIGLAVAAATLLMAGYELVQNVGDENNNVPDSVADWFFGTVGGVLVTIPDIAGGEDETEKLD